MSKRLRCFFDESYPKLVSHAPHALLRGLHQERHCRIVLFDEPAQIYARITFFSRRGVPLVYHESDVGNDSKNVAFISFIQADRFVIACSHKDFRTGTLAHVLLLFIQRVLYGFHILLKNKLI